MTHCSRVLGYKEGGKLTEIAKSTAQAGMMRSKRTTYTFNKNCTMINGGQDFIVKVTSVSCKVGPGWGTPLHIFLREDKLGL